MQEQVQQLPDHILIKIIKEVYKLSKGDYKDYQGFIKKIAAMYKSFTAEDPKKLKKDTSLEEDAKIVARLNNDIEIAIAKLKSVNSVDSPFNDLAILQQMVEISRLISRVSVNVKGLNKVQEKAAIAYGNVSVTTGSSGNVMQGAAAQQQEKISRISLSESMKFNLQEGTSSVDFMPPITKEHEKKRNENYASSVNDLISKERKN